MYPYYIAIFLSSLFALIAQQTRLPERNSGTLQPKAPKLTRFFLIMVVLPLLIISGLRFEIGSDFAAYYKADQTFQASFWSALRNLHEPMIIPLIRFVNLFTDDGAAYIFLFSFLTTCFSAYFILKGSNEYLFAILLYVFCGCWHGAFNGVRQYLAATVLLFGHKYIVEKKFFRFSFTVFIAYLTHSSAVVFFVLYFVMRAKLNVRNLLLLVLGTILVSRNYDLIFSFINIIKDKDVTMNAYATSSVNILRVLANCCPAILVIVLYWNRTPDKWQTFYINGLIINAAAMVASSNSTYLARIGVYTSFFIPLGLPRLVYLKNKQLQFALRALIVVLFAIFWNTEVTRHPAMNPYNWVFNRP